MKMIRNKTPIRLNGEKTETPMETSWNPRERKTDEWLSWM